MILEDLSRAEDVWETRKIRKSQGNAPVSGVSFGDSEVGTPPLERIGEQQNSRDIAQRHFRLQAMGSLPRPRPKDLGRASQVVVQSTFSCIFRCVASFDETPWRGEVFRLRTAEIRIHCYWADENLGPFAVGDEV